jgi:tagaturonate reductase
VEEYVQLTASNISFWGRDLTLVPGFEQAAARFLEKIRSMGPRAAMNELNKE